MLNNERWWCPDKAQTTGISSHPRGIDLVLMPTNIDGLQSGGAKIQGWVSQSRGSVLPPQESVVLLHHKGRTVIQPLNK